MKHVLSALAVAILLSSTAGATPPGPIDGANIKTDFGGTAVALQNNHTGFGDYAFVGLSPGSELDELFIAKDAAFLYVGLTGNLQQNGNAFMICFNSPNRVGQSGELRTEGVDGPPFTLQKMGRELLVDDNGTPEDPTDDVYTGYGADGVGLPCDTDYVIAVDIFEFNANFSLYTLHDPAGAPVGTFDPTPDNNGDENALPLFAERSYVASDTVVTDPNATTNDDTLTEQGGSGFTRGGFVNTNAVGVTLVDGTTAATATKGLELAVPLGLLGLTGNDNFEIYVLLVDGSDAGSPTGNVTNQILPPLVDPLNAPCDPPGSLGVRPVDLDPLMDCAMVDLSTAMTFNGLADGFVVDADYGGAAVAVQHCPIPEEYGDQVPDPTAGRLGGSELDGLYVDHDANSLYLGITGNVKEGDGGHRLNIWIDSVDGGEHILDWDPFFGDPGNGMEDDALPPLDDTVTDALFDYVISANLWPVPPEPVNCFVDFGDLVANAGSYKGASVMESGDGLLTGGDNQWGMEIAINNLNDAGVIGCGLFELPCWFDSPQADVEALAAQVETGAEVRLPLADLGINPCDGEVTVHIWVNITDKGGWRANQTLPPLRDPAISPFDGLVWNPGGVPTDWYVSALGLPEEYYRTVAYTYTFTPTGFENDCNGNLIEDMCDILSGTSLDTNFDGVPDECQGTPCPWDLDNDGVVTPFDANFVLARFGCAVGQGDPACDASDIDGDGAVNPFDSNAVLANFGPCP